MATICTAQPNVDKVRDSIEREGRILYRSEIASWYGTDIFLAKFKDRQQDIGGYFSYAEGDSTRCIFFDKDNLPLVMATITFDSSYNPDKAIIDGLPRKFTGTENILYNLRKKAFAEVKADTLFASYKNTSLNLIPVIGSQFNKVYVITDPEKDGVVIFGNDYLITCDKNNNIIDKQRLHKNLIPIKFAKGDTLRSMISMHSHSPETGDFATATDICTLMLYEKFAGWKQHYIMSENYVSVWDCDANRLKVLTVEAWRKISGPANKNSEKATPNN